MTRPFPGNGISWWSVRQRPIFRTWRRPCLSSRDATTRVLSPPSSEDLVSQLRSQGKDLDLLIFEDEGHDVLKYENRVRCYNAIADFFTRHLNP